MACAGQRYLVSETLDVSYVRINPAYNLFFPKVAEHSFWRALLLMRFSTCTGIMKTNMPLIQ